PKRWSARGGPHRRPVRGTIRARWLWSADWSAACGSRGPIRRSHADRTLVTGRISPPAEKPQVSGGRTGPVAADQDGPHVMQRSAHTGPVVRGGADQPAGPGPHDRERTGAPADERT